MGIADDITAGPVGPAPPNCMRFALPDGVTPSVSVNGGSYVPIGGASFGADTIVTQPNNVPAQVSALELLLSMPPTAPGSEKSLWVVKTLINGVQKIIGGFGQTGNLETLFFGDPANLNGVKNASATQQQFISGGTNFFHIDNSAGNSFNVVTTIASSRFRRAVAGSTAIATTITLPSALSLTGGNLFPCTVGTGTLNSIVATNFAAGDEIKLVLPSGVTITHNVAGSGATILTNTAASIVTASKRVIPMYYDGTNFIVEG